MKSPCLRWFLPALTLCLGGLLCAPGAALAQIDDEGYEVAPGGSGGGDGYGWGEEDEGPADPLRILTTFTFGTSIRFIQDLDYAQERFAPAYLDLWGGIVLPGNGIRHAFGLQAALNVTGDGDSSIGVDPGSQLVLGPSYGLYIPFDDFLLFPKFTLPIAVSSGPSLGFELSVGAAYRFLAGFGLYAELGASVWIGGSTSVHPLVSGELGVIIDYEVLP